MIYLIQLISMKTYRIKIDSKWISKDNILMLTDNIDNAACLNEGEMLNLKELLCGCGDKIEIIEVQDEIFQEIYIFIMYVRYIFII